MRLCIRGVVVYHEVAFHIIGKMTNYAIKGIRPLPTNVKEKKKTQRTLLLNTINDMNSQ